jgi:GT2 family glycosyltransferase
VQVSFIIPLFNNLALTRACVESLQATLSRGLKHEIILVDDGSTDGTREWLATLAPPFRSILNERNLGYAAANNRGVSVARGEILALLNNDLILLPHWFEPMLGAHRSLDDRAGLVGNIQLDARTGAIDHTGIVIGHQVKPVHDRTMPSRWSRFFTTVRRVPAVTGACVLLERALWQRLGGFDEGYVNGGEDVDLCFRARALGRLNAVALTSVVRHHISASVGRKLRDEENSYRLARRWRREHVAACDVLLRGWCRAHFEKILPYPREADPVLARRAWLYAHGLTRTPPPEAFPAVEAVLQLEFDRWEKMFPSATPTGA